MFTWVNIFLQREPKWLNLGGDAYSECGYSSLLASAAENPQSGVEAP